VLVAASVTAVLYLAFRPVEAGGAQPRGALGELSRSGALVRTFAPRLSHQVSFRKCVARPAPDSTIPRAECDGDLVSPPAAVLELSLRAAREVRDSASPHALHASALIDLVWSGTAGIPLDRSITSLQSAARVSDRPGPALADLAAAHLVRAGQRQSAYDLVQALDAAEGALEAEPGNVAALFNRALALEWLGVDAQAAGAWRAFLAADSTSDWAAEARRHLRAEPAPRKDAMPLAADAAPRTLEAYATSAPQEARVHGWTVALGGWGSATLRGDAQRAGESLRQAEMLGGALERRGGDATLADAVRAIRSATPAAARVLAEGHRGYAAAQGLMRAEKAGAAAEALAQVVALRPPSPALARWVEHGRAAATAVAGDKEGAERLLDAMRADLDTLRHPALAGQVYGALAGVRLRMARYQGALEAAERAAWHMERAREVEGVAGALYRKADAEYALGANAAAYGTVHRALMLLRGNPTSSWRGNALSSGARVAMADGLVRAALRFQDERVALAERAGRPVHMAEARVARAEIRGAAGDEAGAAADMRAAAALTPSIPPGDALRWITADLRLARADAARRTSPRQALAMLDSALMEPDGPRPAMRRLLAIVARADTRLSLGDARGASADLERVSGLLADQRAEVASIHLRASLLDTAREVFDRMVMLRLAAGDTVGALAYLEKGRASLHPARAAASAGTPSLRIPLGRVGLSYALMGDTLLAWTVAGRDVRLTRTTVRSDSLARRIERVHSALEVRARETALRPDLEALYDVLVRPVAARLGGEGTEVVIVADGEIAGVPFAALRDRARSRYLVEDHPTRFAGTLADAGRAPAAGDAGGVLLVADPAFDERAHPAVPRLPAARAEVAALAALYRGARVLEGGAATPSALVRGLRGAGIVHFAGHATFDDTHPGRSSLVLAPDRGPAGGGSLTADSLAGLELRGVRLVVLSACQTLRARGGRSGGFAGFAAALGGAGAGGVLGSLWRVDDELTGPVMEAFHRRYRSLGDPSRALRDAQLQMLRSSDPALRAPAAWAGFRYAGA
jgi:CHAT domain-containing protein